MHNATDLVKSPFLPSFERPILQHQRNQLRLGVGIAVPVVAGLAVGVALIAVFSIMLKPVSTMTDDELRRIISSQYPQFQALKERYPNTIERIERYEWATYVHYEATKELLEAKEGDTFFGGGPTALAITLTIKPLSGRTIDVSCGSGLSVSLPATVQTIKNTDCLETP